MIWHGKNFRGFLNKASQVLFNKTGTTLNSTNVQDAICEISSNLSGLKAKTFDYDYQSPTVAGTMYSVSNAKIDVFGLTVADTVEGIAIREIGGNNASVFTYPTYFSGGDNFSFKPDAANTTHVRFRGVVFYR